MNIESIITTNRSKEVIQSIIDTIIAEPKKLEELMSIIQNEDFKNIHYRAYWILGYLAPMGSDAFEKYWDFLFNQIKKEDNHPTITRSTTRLLQYLILPEKYHGEIIDISFKILTSEQQELAQRANTMSIIYNYSKMYPDLQQELKFVIEEILEYKKEASIQSRGQKILKKLNKIHHEHQH